LNVAQVAPTSPPEAILDWAQFGVLGLLIIAGFAGFVWFKPSVEQLLAAIRRLEETVRRLEDQNGNLREEIGKLRQQHSTCEATIKELNRELDRERR
jgi:septal ring factor EnvC (AmiA/AmiB activator)